MLHRVCCVTICWRWHAAHGAWCMVPMLLLNCCRVHPQGACDRGAAIDVLQKKQNVLNHLVETVCNLVSQLRQKIAAGTQAAACESSSSGGAATDAATIQAEALAELRQGSWTYTEILREYILTLKLLASFEIEYFPEDLAGQLWDALMNAPTKDHMTAALVRLFGGLSAGAECSRLARSVSDWQTVVSGAGKAVRERKGASRLCLCVGGCIRGMAEKWHGLLSLNQLRKSWISCLCGMLFYISCTLSLPVGCCWAGCLQEACWQHFDETGTCTQPGFLACPCCWLMQAFFRGGYIETPNSTPYFDDKTQRQLLEQHLVQQDVSEMSLAAAKLTWDIFAIVSACFCRQGSQLAHPCVRRLVWAPLC